MSQTKKSLWKLFATFFKIGAFTFGGGYAMISIIENECVSEKKWLTHDEMMDITVVAESTPGPIAINAATYIGYKQLGFLGALACTVAICIPSVVIIFAISLFFDAFLSLKLVEYAFRGIQVCVVYLIFRAGLKMLKQMKKTPLSVTIVVTVVLCMIAFSLLAVKFSTILYILICGCIGLVIYLIKQAKHKKEGAT